MPLRESGVIYGLSIQIALSFYFSISKKWRTTGTERLTTLTCMATRKRPTKCM